MLSKLVVLTAGASARRYLDSGAINAPVREQIESNNGGIPGVRERVNSPLVQATSDQMCLFKEDYNEWCWNLYSPVLEAGYEIEQKADQEAQTWQIVVKPYITPFFKFTSELILTRILMQNLSIEISKFTMDVFYSFLVTGESGQVCFALGWDLPEVTYTVITSFSFKNCYKTLINDLCDFSQWLSPTATWLEECEDSEMVNMYDRKTALIPKSYNQVFMGGLEPDGVGCFQYAKFNNWAPYVAQAAFNAVTGLEVGERKAEHFVF